MTATAPSATWAPLTTPTDAQLAAAAKAYLLPDFAGPERADILHAMGVALAHETPQGAVIAYYAQRGCPLPHDALILAEDVRDMTLAMAAARAVTS